MSNHKVVPRLESFKLALHLYFNRFVLPYLKHYNFRPRPMSPLLGFKVVLMLLRFRRPNLQPRITISMRHLQLLRFLLRQSKYFYNPFFVKLMGHINLKLLGSVAF